MVGGVWLGRNGGCLHDRKNRGHDLGAVAHLVLRLVFDDVLVAHGFGSELLLLYRFGDFGALGLGILVPLPDAVIALGRVNAHAVVAAGGGGHGKNLVYRHVFVACLYCRRSYVLHVKEENVAQRFVAALVRDLVDKSPCSHRIERDLCGA